MEKYPKADEKWANKLTGEIFYVVSVDDTYVEVMHKPSYQVSVLPLTCFIDDFSKITCDNMDKLCSLYMILKQLERL